MDANLDILQGAWPALKGQVKLRWGKLTDEDVQRLSGYRAELVSLLQELFQSRRHPKNCPDRSGVEVITYPQELP